MTSTRCWFWYCFYYLSYLDGLGLAPNYVALSQNDSLVDIELLANDGKLLRPRDSVLLSGDNYDERVFHARVFQSFAIASFDASKFSASVTALLVESN